MVFHLVHGPGRHSLFLQPGHGLSFSSLPEEAVSEKRFIAVLREIHLHSWSFIFVLHDGHVHRDFFCFLFLSFFLELVLLTGFECQGLDSAGSLSGSVTDAHPFFQVSVLQGLSGWILQRTL